jgi:RNA polymerase sigma-70 factor (ECF subfamily)
VAVSATFTILERSTEAPAGGTLGAVLYAGKIRAHLPEAYWAELVRSVTAHDQARFAELYARTHRLVFTLIVRIVGSRETAEELTIDVFHDIWRRAAAYDEKGGTVLGWVMNQARSRAIDRIRFEQRKKRQPSPADPILGADGVDAPEAMLLLRQQGQRLRHAMTVLAPTEREAIELAFFADMTYAEVAERLREPAGTIKTRIRCGLTKLRLTLGEAEGHP